MDFTKVNEIKDVLKHCLDKERFEHSIGTAECAAELANKYAKEREGK